MPLCIAPACWLVPHSGSSCGKTQQLRFLGCGIINETIFRAQPFGQLRLTVGSRAVYGVDGSWFHGSLHNRPHGNLSAGCSVHCTSYHIDYSYRTGCSRFPRTKEFTSLTSEAMNGLMTASGPLRCPSSTGDRASVHLLLRASVRNGGRTGPDQERAGEWLEHFVDQPCGLSSGIVGAHIVVKQKYEVSSYSCPQRLSVGFMFTANCCGIVGGMAHCRGRIHEDAMT
ncbi:hypothetical protein B0J13DRAFT_523957 [Dactylonectria estremocensis]|uniref:Uncharacterized protein n=1 Tax=Dactylonectria estremocensis TaxID=1079267 RepID=A0A9P9J9J9_9HYPO|nr:hypothetical protein B0J13DRAFT_523957 [Dactylonectria estremocensis]